MSRISEAVTHIEHSLETAIIDCDRRGRPVSARGIADVMKDIRLIKCGLLPVNEIMGAGAMSADVIAYRIKGRLEW